MDANGGHVLSPSVTFVSTGEVRCALPVLELPGTMTILMQVSNDGARWSTQDVRVKNCIN